MLNTLYNFRGESEDKFKKNLEKIKKAKKTRISHKKELCFAVVMQTRCKGNIVHKAQGHKGK